MNSTQPPVPALEKPYLLDFANLKKNLALVQQGDAGLQPALEALLAEAEKAFTAGPWTVTAKGLVPPSGDKHDYMSLGPYWWPDPESPDGLPYIRRDGEVNPQRTSTDTDYAAYTAMADATVTLAWAAYFSGEERYARRAAENIRVWFLDVATRMNPNLNFGQSIPGVVEGRDIGIIDTRGLVFLLDAAACLPKSCFTAGDRAALLQWVNEYLDWLLHSEHGRGERGQYNNHGTWWDVQAVSFALHCGREAVARTILETVGAERIAKHIAADGSQPHELKRTLSFSYSVLNLQGLLYLAVMGRSVGIDLWKYRGPEGQGLEAAVQFLVPYASGELAWPYPQLHFGSGDLLTLANLFGAARVGSLHTYPDMLKELPGGATRERARLLLF